YQDTEFVKLQMHIERDLMSKNDDIIKKNSFLYVIRYDTSSIKDKLARLKDLIDKYSEDPKPEKWENVKGYSRSEMKWLEETRKYIIRHLDIIGYLVKNHRLDSGKFDYVYIKYTVDLFYDAYYMDPQYDQPGLADLIIDIEDQVGQLDAALQFLDTEKVV
ncbi:MAG: hypothetical protein M3247_07380, partial [Thermoproteota archaeon]|nr:hypothetical protein [Thermoproteota archaeon]